MKKLLLIAVLALVAACTTPPATVEVKVPVPVKCDPVVPAKPDYRTPRLGHMATDYQKIVALVQDWVDSRKYELQLETALIACL